MTSTPDLDPDLESDFGPDADDDQPGGGGDASGPGLNARAAGLAASLADWPRRKAALTDLWRLFDAADPASLGSRDRRALLADTLNELDAAGLISLPGATSWDRTTRPPLPRFVWLPAAATAPAPARTVVWHPALAWAAHPGLTPTQRGYLKQINTWLHGHRDDLVVPLRERSLDIFGKEKILDRLVRTNLFAPDRLTLALLRARRVAPRLTVETIGDGDTLLVVENSDTFDSLVHALAPHPDRIGLVGWGAGAGFQASVLSIPRLGRPIREVRYFGDLDGKGLEIPTYAADLAATEDLPPIRPATGLYTALIANARPQPGQPAIAADTATRLAAWLPGPLQPAAIAHLTSGHRLAQEAIGLAYLIRRDDWRLGL